MTALRCRLCGTDIAAGDRFCRFCGTSVAAPADTAALARKRKVGRAVAAAMFLAGVALVLFALVHRDPADLILVVTLGVPLIGVGAAGWRSR